MPDQNHIATLKLGVEAWNTWRSKTHESPDLRDADLQGLNLDRVGLANAQGADFTNARLDGANLTRADLRGADFTLANLRGAILVQADLRETYFHVANMRAANLTDSDIRGAGKRISVLIPLFLDKHIFQWVDGRATHLRSRLAGDFCDWQQPSKFDNGFKRLLTALHAGELIQEKRPEPKLTKE